MDLADQVNKWRIIPRAMVGLYGYIFYETLTWFMALPAPTGPQATFITIVVGAAAAFFGFYVNSGAK